MATLGSIGEKLDIVCRQGTSVGPFNITLENPDGTPFNLTGCAISGHVRKNASDTSATAQFSISVTDALQGKFSFELSWQDTAAMIAGNFIKDPESQYVWDMNLTDASSRIIPLYYGAFEVYRAVTHA